MKNMLLTLILFLFSNAVTLNKDKSVLYSRAVISSLLFIILLMIDNFHVTPLIKGVPIYGGLFNITITTYVINMFIYCVGIHVMVKVGFFGESISKIIYFICLSAIIIIKFRILYLIFMKVFNFWLLASMLTSVSVVIIVAVKFGLEGETRSLMFYFRLFCTKYVINIILMWVQLMVSDTVDPFQIYPLLYILGLDKKGLLDNINVISYLTNAPWDNKPVKGVYKPVAGEVNYYGFPMGAQKGLIGVTLNRYYTHCTNFDGRKVLVAYNKPHVEHMDYRIESVYPWTLTPDDIVPRYEVPITWFWGIEHNAIVFPHNPRLDPTHCVFNLFKDNEVARKEYFFLKKEIMIHYSHLNIAETQTNIWLLNEQKNRFNNSNNKPKL